MLLLILHGLVDDVDGPEGPVGAGGLAGGGLDGGAEVSGAVSFLFILLYFIFFLLSGLLTDGVPPDSGLGAGLWLRLPGDVVGGGVLDPPLLLEGLAGGWRPVEVVVLARGWWCKLRVMVLCTLETDMRVGAVPA